MAGKHDHPHPTTASWLRDDEAERHRENGEDVSDRGHDRDHEARKRGFGGDTGHDPSWSGPSSSTRHKEIHKPSPATPRKRGSRREPK